MIILLWPLKKLKPVMMSLEILVFIKEVLSSCILSHIIKMYAFICFYNEELGSEEKETI